MDGEEEKDHKEDDIHTITHRHPALLQSFLTQTHLNSSPSALLDRLLLKPTAATDTMVATPNANVIDRIVAMGFDRQAVETMFSVCEQNEELTISMLLGQ